jgi:hypothetical protein
MCIALAAAHEELGSRKSMLPILDFTKQETVQGICYMLLSCHSCSMLLTAGEQLDILLRIGKSKTRFRIDNATLQSSAGVVLGKCTCDGYSKK